MKIETLHLLEGAKQARGLTVVIDVFRAFSTACYVIANGAEQVIPVGDIDIAYKLKETNPDFDLCLDLNRFNFVLRAEPYEQGLVALRKVNSKAPRLPLQ